MDKKIQQLLTQNKIKFKTIQHRKVYTAFTEAETQHVDPKTVVKTVFVKLSKPTTHLLQDGKVSVLDSILVAVPAGKRVDFKKIAKAVNEHAVKSYKIMIKTPSNSPSKRGRTGTVKKPPVITVKMANEKDILKKLKTKVGLLSAFSQIYNLPLLFDKKLLKNKKLILSAGSYTESIELSTKDFLKIMVGMQGNFTQ
jgi:prolyl-tRNA editing enzyme YbaK/EbsC (Cys-tRNA(Pro) deacylase)